MITNNTFNFARFGLLCRQNFIHNHKLVLRAVVGFCGALFMLLLIIQFLERFQPVDSRRFFWVFMFVSAGIGILFAGAAFPAFRSKEKSLGYLMNPASSFEKFTLEFIGRILIFIAIIPFLYWGVYNLEANLVKLFNPAFTFDGQVSAFTSQIHFDTDRYQRWQYILTAFACLLILVIPFTGSTIFQKNPLIKTLFSIAIIFFFNVSLVFLLVEVLQIRMYRPSMPILFMSDEKDALVVSVVGCLILNLGLISAAYFKLKEKEV